VHFTAVSDRMSFVSRGARTETLEEEKQVAAGVGGGVCVEGHRSAQEHQLDCRIALSSASNACATR
jgi:hypothetical protein